MKIREVGIFEAKKNLSQLVETVRAGSVVYLTKHGKRVAEVRPLSKERVQRKAGFMKGYFGELSPDFDAPLEDFKDYM
jgi:prevent-host-death family protein